MRSTIRTDSTARCLCDKQRRSTKAPHVRSLPLMRRTASMNRRSLIFCPKHIRVSRLHGLRVLGISSHEPVPEPAYFYGRGAAGKVASERMAGGFECQRRSSTTRRSSRSWRRTVNQSNAHRVSQRVRTLFPLLGERVRVRGNGATATQMFRTLHCTVELFESPGRAGGFPGRL